MPKSPVTIIAETDMPPGLVAMGYHINSWVSGIMASVFKGIRNEICDAIKESGEDIDNYRIGSYPGEPFVIERIDGKRVGRKVLEAIKKRLKTD